MMIECERCSKHYDIRIRHRPRNGVVEVACPWCDFIILVMFRKPVPIDFPFPVATKMEKVTFCWKENGF